jgi:hypothetical protein
MARQEVYIAGTQPVQACPLHGGNRSIVTSVSGWDTNPPAAKLPTDDGLRPPAPNGEVPLPVARRAPPRQDNPQTTQQQSQPQQKEEKKGFFHKLWGVFK